MESFAAYTFPSRQLRRRSGTDDKSSAWESVALTRCPKRHLQAPQMNICAQCRHLFGHASWIRKIKTPSEGETFADHTQKRGRRLSRRFAWRRRASGIAFVRRRTVEPVSDFVPAPLPSERCGGIRVLQGALACCPDAPDPLPTNRFRGTAAGIQYAPDADRTSVLPPPALRRGLVTSPSRLCHHLALGTGFEPATARLRVWCSSRLS
jgi:hypothetical protein